MEQLLLNLLAPEPPRFDNFLPGPNTEALASLRQNLRLPHRESVLYLWGPPGCGKTHLLRAAVAEARASAYLSGSLLAVDEPGLATVAIDDVHLLHAENQAKLFTLLNRQRERGGLVLASGELPPAQLALREDVRNRLAWGLVFELKPLSDEEKPMALVDYARARGFRIPTEVIDYLLKHGRRDMGTLLRQLATLDHQSLVQKRPVSLALLRRMARTQAEAL